MASEPSENGTEPQRMSIGEFSRRSQLSPKALRLYDELGLLAPARVDERSGYRFYAEAQLERARLVAALRELRLPLAEVAKIVDLGRPEAAARLERTWAEQEHDHAARRALAAHLIDRLNGKRSPMYDVDTRQIATRTLLCLKRNVAGQEGVWSFGKEFVGLVREHRFPRLPGREGAAFQIFWSEVSEDSDGPIEWCLPVPSEQAQELAARSPALTLRTEPEHREAFVNLGPGGQTSPAQWQLVVASLQAWAEERRIQPTELGARVTYLSSGPGSEGPGPDCDFAVPFVSVRSAER